MSRKSDHGPEKHSRARHPSKAAQRGVFDKFARFSARTAGQPPAFVIATATIVVWAITGPFFHFNDTWQLVINTATSVATFLMVFLIQSTQNRDSEAVQIKLDELIRATKLAHNAVLEIEELSEHELDELKARYIELAKIAREEVRTGKSDLGSPEMNKSRN